MSTTTGFPENPVHPSVHPAGPAVQSERHTQKIIGAVVVSSISGTVFISIFIWIYLRRRAMRKSKGRAASISGRPNPSEISILPAGLSENFSFAPKVSVIPPTPDAYEEKKHLALPNVSEVMSGPAQPALPPTEDIQPPRISRRSWANRASFRLSFASMSSGPSPRTSVLPADSANKNLIHNMAEPGLSDVVSVPLNVSAALDLIETVKPYWEWQSTISYLKTPPAEYVEKIQDPVDVFGELDIIESKVKNGSFANEYEFGLSIYRLLQSTHDGHFVYVPDSVGGIFNFGRTLPLVSVSVDGKSLPQPYAYPDILEASLGDSSFTPSPIVKIDGEPATTWLENWSQYGSLQDRDALYNNVFYELAIVALGNSSAGMGTFTGGGRGRWIYPGATTTIQFENGTSVVLNNFAKVLTDFDGVDSGEALYKKKFAVPADHYFQNGALNTATTTTTATPTSTSASTNTKSTPAPGYPTPVVRQENNLIGGYYLDGEDYADIAVLSVPSFVGSSNAGISFQETSQRFLAEAVAAGKTKLVIDLSANGGGTILQGYDLFKQLFPSIDAFAAADRTRALESIDLLGQSFSEISGTVPRTLDWGKNETLEELEEDIVSSNFNYRTDETPEGKPFNSWAEKFGPHEFNGDQFSSLFRWNLSDVLTPINSGGIQIQGYSGYRTNFTQPFATENIVVLTDGYCASTCTIFSRLMTDLAGVKYVAMGGRSTSGIIQAIGGVKGTNDFGWDYIQEIVSLAYANANATQKAFYNTTSLADFNDQIPFLRAANDTAYNINFRDGIKIGDFEEQTPLQFVYEPADCRIYWTPDMTVDITAAWKAVADSAWGSTDWCVAGRVKANSTVRVHSNVASRYSRPAVIESVPIRQRARREDYPLDVYTDLRGQNLKKKGYMVP
ncbi:hypothetical protein IWZ03DRAFT_423667 [Phyllosticta citriasiana]|uniref:Tail specific protease domain-containing protein n=1 Tax=Phyllosticta citriasiana TaxID=595635 RepID=A0ABR1KKI2_9PEZI